MKKLYLKVCICLIVVIVTSFFLWKYWSEPKKNESATVAKDEIKIENVVKQLLSQYHLDCQNLMEKYNQRFQKKLTSEFAYARSKIPAAVAEFCSLSVSTKLCLLLVYDKLNNENNFSSRCREILNEPLIKPVENSSCFGSELIKNLQLELNERYFQLQADLALATAAINESTSLNISNLSPEIQKLQTDITNNSLSNFSATLGLGIEAIFIRQTIKSSALLFAKPVAKLTTLLGISGVSAIADGPLPVGDVAGAIISAGGLVWSVIDVNYIVNKLPPKLHNQWEKTIDTIESKLWHNFCKTTRTLTNKYKL